jgi:hypothetical protein
MLYYNNLTKGIKKMTIENIQFKINDKLEKRIANLERNNNNHEITNKILTSLLVVLYSQSTLTSKTTKELSTVIPKIVKDINVINPLINDV